MDLNSPLTDIRPRPSYRMRIKPCRIDQFFGKYEFTSKYLLSSSDAESRNIKELLELEPGAHERFLQQWCGYTESPGAPALREVISEIDRKSTRLNSSHSSISYAVFCLKKK